MVSRAYNDDDGNDTILLQNDNIYLSHLWVTNSNICQESQGWRKYHHHQIVLFFLSMVIEPSSSSGLKWELCRRVCWHLTNSFPKDCSRNKHNTLSEIVFQPLQYSDDIVLQPTQHTVRDSIAIVTILRWYSFTTYTTHSQRQYCNRYNTLIRYICTTIGY